MVAASKPPVSMKFRVTPGARLRKADADILGPAFEAIKKAGPLTAESVLAAAKPGTALHRFFEWNDKKAAHEYRLEQARRLIRSIEVVIEDGKGKTVAMKGFFSVENAQGARSYEPMEFVFNTPDLSDQVIAEAHAQLQSWLERYKKYAWAKSAVPKVVAALRAIKKPSKRKRTR